MNKDRIRQLLRELRYIVPTVYFNFRYLPLRQAWRLPIVLYKPHFVSCKGKVRIEPTDGSIHHAMVQMGFRIVNVYPNSGITWENNGGTVVFRGRAIMGNDTYVSVGVGATADIGTDFRSSAGMKLVAFKGIRFGHYNRVGWGCLFLDTNMHPLYDTVKEEYLPASGAIDIGDHNWFAAECKVMHGVQTPERCIFSLGTIVTRKCPAKSYCVMGGSPVRILRENVMRVIGHDTEPDN